MPIPKDTADLLDQLDVAASAIVAELIAARAAVGVGMTADDVATVHNRLTAVISQITGR